MSNNLFFSVNICCFNSEKYIRETVDSVINQTYTNWEIIVVNDGSCDGTEEIIHSYINQGIPIIYHYQENSGFASARNKAMELSNADWIVLIDHDDICISNRLEIQANHILENANAKLFFGNTIHFNDEGSELRRQFDRFNPCGLDLRAGLAMNNLLSHGCFIDTEGVVFNKEAALSIGGFSMEYKFVIDYDFFIRMGSKFDIFAGEEIVSKWRVHEKQATQNMTNIIPKEDMMLLKKYFWAKNVTSNTRFSMIFIHLKKYIKRFFFKI